MIRLIEMETKAINLYDSKEYHPAYAAFKELSSTAKEGNVRLDCLFNAATCLASAGDFSGALEILNDIENGNGASQDSLYNKALCNYKLSEYKKALELVNELLQNCHEKYPELSIANDDLLQVLRDDKQGLLQGSCLVEGINLKAAIIYKLHEDSQDSLISLNEIPFIRHPEQLDCVTLHNQAIFESENNWSASFSKLVHLVELAGNQELDLASSVSSETFKNFILLLISHGQFEDASNSMKSNESLIRKYLTKNWLSFLEILLEQLTAPIEVIYRKLSNLFNQLLEEILESDKQQGETDIKQSANKADLIRLATTVAEQQCQILWNYCQYQTLEKLLAKINSTLNDTSDKWAKIEAHNLFMMDTRYSDSADMYEKFLPQSTAESLINVEPIILGNLCVSYVLTGRNGEAEALMKDVETDETNAMHEIDSTVLFDGRQLAGYKNRASGHNGSCLCYINMIIGTLYCVKLNYDFGLSRIFKSLLPIEQKLNAKTWFYVKRCILSLLDCHCKQMICVKDDLFQQVVSFLIQCEKHGLLIETTGSTRATPDSDNLTEQEHQYFHERNSVTYEARYLRSIILTVVHEY